MATNDSNIERRKQRNLAAAKAKIAGAKQARDLKVLIVVGTIAIIAIGATWRPNNNVVQESTGSDTSSSSTAATTACETAIERMLPFRHEWSSSFLTRWSEPSLGANPGTLTVTGRELLAENAFGAMMKVQYFCTYDQATGKAIAAGIPTLDIRRDM